MKRVVTMVLAAVAIATGCFATASLAHAVSSPSASRVTIVVATGLTWADITPTATPTLWRLAQTGAVGNVNARMRNREIGDAPSALEGALDLSTGNWATPDFLAGAAYNTSEAVGAISAGEVFRRNTGTRAGSSAICYTGMPMARAANSDPEAGAVPGALGQAVRDAGGVTGAVGNSDAGTTPSGPRLQRPAAIVAMDARGLVDAGDVSAGVLRQSPDAAYGAQTDLGAFDRALGAFDASATAHGGPALLVLDPGDAYRARRNAAQVSPSVASRQHSAAASELDRVVSLAQAHSAASDTLIVVSESPAGDAAAGVQGFGPVLVAGPGMVGYLSSASTHRPGIVTNPDVTAAALQAISVTRPVQMIGSAFTTSGAPSTPVERIAHLTALNSTAVAVDGLRSLVADAYIKLFIAVLAFAGLILLLRDRIAARVGRMLTKGTIVASLLLLTVIPAGWLMFVGSPTVATYSAAGVRLVLASVVLLAAALAIWRWLGVRTAAGFLSLFSVGLLVVDQFFGAPLSFSNLMGYSPLQSSRYYGMGNQPAAYVVGATIVGIAVLLDRWPDAMWSKRLRTIGFPIAALVVVASAAAPFWGANVGVAIWASAGFIVAWMLFNQHRVTWRTALVIVIVAVILVVGFAAFDVFGNSPKTHLARSVASAQQGGVGQLWLIVARKAQTNARVLGETEWSWALYSLIAFVAGFSLHRRRDLPDSLAENPALRSAMAATAVAGVLAFLTEDSGIIVPAFLVLPFGATLVAVLLSRVLAQEASR